MHPTTSTPRHRYGAKYPKTRPSWPRVTRVGASSSPQSTAIVGPTQYRGMPAA